MNPDTKYMGIMNKYREYTDYDFDDGDLCSLWSITYDEESNTWFGIHRTSETPDGDFEDYGREMTPDEVKFCRSLIPDADLPVTYILNEGD
jgi:hypothetical protein